jgi:DNA-binding MarR family transcriptional regulator
MPVSSTAASLIPPIVEEVYELAGRFRARGEMIAAAAGQTQARWQIMSVASGQPRTVPQIARRLGVTRQNVQRIADILVRDHWARYDSNPDHGTSPFLVLEERGAATLMRITHAAEAWHAETAARFTQAELRSIHRGLRRLLDATRAMPSEKEC